MQLKRAPQRKKDKLTYHVTEGLGMRVRVKTSSSTGRGGIASVMIVNVAAEADAVNSPLALDARSIIGIAVGVSFVEAACPAATLDASSGALILWINEKSAISSNETRALASLKTFRKVIKVSLQPLIFIL
jgi:hypothetical protein